MRPNEIELELVGLCNATCCYCRWQEKAKPLKSYMAVDLAKKVLDEAAALGIPLIRYHGIGESTLHPQFMEILEYGIQSGVGDHSISTNCSLLAGDLAERLSKKSGMEVILAIPWVDDGMRDRCSENALNYLKMRPDNRLLNVQMVCHVRVESYWQQFIERFLPYVDGLKNAVITMKQPRTWPGDEVQHGFRPTGVSHPQVHVDQIRTPSSAGMGCAMPMDVLMVMADGTCSPCCSSIEDWKMGNMVGSSIMGIWNTDRARFIRHAWSVSSDAVPCGQCKTRTDCATK